MREYRIEKVGAAREYARIKEPSKRFYAHEVTLEGLDEPVELHRLTTAPWPSEGERYAGEIKKGRGGAMPFLSVARRLP